MLPVEITNINHIHYNKHLKVSLSVEIPIYGGKNTYVEHLAESPSSRDRISRLIDPTGKHGNCVLL